MRPTALFVLLAACQPAAEPAPTGPAPEARCPAADYAGLVGANLAAVTLPADLNARITGAGRLVTADYVPERMNIRVDRDGTILDVTCG